MELHKNERNQLKVVMQVSPWAGVASIYPTIPANAGAALNSYVGRADGNASAITDIGQPLACSVQKDFHPLPPHNIKGTKNN